MGALLSPGGLIMRKKLIRLTLVLAVLAAASLSSSVFADDCDTPEIHCCADGRCITCCEPCAIRCTV